MTCRLDKVYLLNVLLYLPHNDHIIFEKISRHCGDVLNMGHTAMWKKIFTNTSGLLHSFKGHLIVDTEKLKKVCGDDNPFLSFKQAILGTRMVTISADPSSAQFKAKFSKYPQTTQLLHIHNITMYPSPITPIADPEVLSSYNYIDELRKSDMLSTLPPPNINDHIVFSNSEIISQIQTAITQNNFKKFLQIIDEFYLLFSTFPALKFLYKNEQQVDQWRIDDVTKFVTKFSSSEFLKNYIDSTNQIVISMRRCSHQEVTSAEQNSMMETMIKSAQYIEHYCQRYTMLGNDINLLEMAIRSKNFSALELLLKRGADVNSHNRSGKTVLMTSVFENDINAVTLLLRNSCDVNKKTYTQHSTALHYACSSYNINLDMVQLLIKYGADVNAQNLHGDSPNCNGIVKFLVECGGKINLTNKSGRTALTKATELGDVDMMKFLVSNGADLTVKTTAGKSLGDIAKQSGRHVLKFYEEIGAF
ncbi:hypothetical protein QTN25_008169 [Entamoeba marina]